MPNMLNVFQSDLFSFTSLTGAVNKIPEKPHELGVWLPWNAQGVNTTSIVVEEKDGQLSVIPTAARGTVGHAVKRDPRRARSFIVPHYPHYDAILATEVQGIRQFGSADAMETVETKRAEKLASMQANHEVTWEFARAGAVTGLLVDADGDTIYDWHAEFGVVRNTHDIALDVATTNVRQELIAAKRKSEVELGGAVVSHGYKLICGSEIFDEIVTHPTVEKAYDRWQDGAFLRADNRKGFMLADDIEVVSYHKSKVGDIDFIEPDEAFLCPIAPIYQVRFAPADTLEAANTIGLPLYTMGEPMPYGRGIDLCTESNHIHYVERPRAIVMVKKS